MSLEDRCAGVEEDLQRDRREPQRRRHQRPASQSSVEAKLQSDTSIDAIVTLGAPIAAISVKAKEEAGSRAEIDTFDLNAAVVKLLKAKDVAFAVDQQPYLQGYEAVDLLWLHKTNADVLGGGKPVLTGPALVTEKDVPKLDEVHRARHPVKPQGRRDPMNRDRSPVTDTWPVGPADRRRRRCGHRTAAGPAGPDSEYNQRSRHGKISGKGESSWHGFEDRGRVDRRRAGGGARRLPGGMQQHRRQARRGGARRQGRPAARPR